MKTKEQIERKLKKVQTRFNYLNSPNPIPLDKYLERELYELSGMLSILIWLESNKK